VTGERRLDGRLPPAEMFPAGVAGIRTRCTTLPGGLRLRVAEAGDEQAPPVLLLHGWAASVYMWRAWFAPLAAAGFRAVAVDLPGHGLSDKPDDAADYRLEAQVAVIRALLDVERLDGAHIVAQSMAGTIALELAATGDARLGRIALVNPACFGRVQWLGLGRLLSAGPMFSVVPHLVTRWSVAWAHRMVYGDPSLITPRDVDEYWAPSQFPAYSRAIWRLVREFQWARIPADIMARRLRVLTSPVLVVLGGRDRLVCDARPYVSALIDAGAPLEVRAVKQGGHAVNEERPAEVVRIALEFLGGKSDRL
jgi:pimeloyl-ACP methyl ester carboxylesterase